MPNDPSGEAIKCGCVATTWYGCIKGHKENCDSMSRYTEDDGTIVEYKHSCDYEQQSILDDSRCVLKHLSAELQQAREERDTACRLHDELGAAFTKLEQQLAQSQAEIESLRTERELKLGCWNGYWEKERDALQLRLDEAEGLLKRAQPVFCSMKCPSVKYGPAPWEHVEECTKMTAFLAHENGARSGE